MGGAVVLDTCVLVPSSLRDLLLELTERGALDACWSTRILLELRATLLKYYSRLGDEPAIGEGYVTATLGRIRAVFPEKEWGGFGSYRSTGAEPDPGDIHVIGVAVEAGANRIMTFNLQDFPVAVMPEGIVAVHPNKALCELADSNPAAVRDAIVAICARSGRKGPKLSHVDFLGLLARAGVPGFARRAIRLFP